MEEITISKLTELLDILQTTSIVIFTYDESGMEYVLTHGKTDFNAKHAAKVGNILKEHIKWPKELCNTKPLERICKNCRFIMNTSEFKIDATFNCEHVCCLNQHMVEIVEERKACKHFEEKCYLNGE